MRKAFKLLMLIFAGIAIFGFTKNNQPRFQNVIVISIDALRPEALSENNTPNISAVMKKGNFTLRGKSISPPLTLHNHAAMFTGVHPREFGMDEDDWHDGDKKVSVPTIFTSAKAAGYETAYYYSKPKLGYLVTSDVNTYKGAAAKSPESPSGANSNKLTGVKTPESAFEFYKKQERPAFVFLHVSGCEWIGPEKGWMSPEYLKTLSDIDERLKPIIELIEKKGKFIIIITSDHGGHEKLHGTDHPDDFKLPFVFYSDMVKKPEIQNMEYTTTMLKGILDGLI